MSEILASALNAGVSSVQPSPSARLSDDVLTRVVSFLTIREQLPLRASCRRLRRVCDSDVLWRSLCSSGAIAPAHPLMWRTLGQRLSCHKWCYSAANANDEGSQTQPHIARPPRAAIGDGTDPSAADGDTRNDEDDQDEQPLLSAPVSGALSPQGRWLKIIQAGLRYESFPGTVLPLVDLVASSKPLSHIKGNNTASIGLIPVDLYPPRPSHTPVVGEESDSEELVMLDLDPSQNGNATKVGKGKCSDPAVALHQKLFSAMGVEFTGDWDTLCEVMRPRKADPQAIRVENSNNSMSPRGQETLPSDPTCPSLHVFDTMPHNGTRRVFAACLSPGDAEEHPNATAKLVEVLLTTCSTVIFAAKSAESLSQWLALVSPHMTLVQSPSPFSTADNTPNIVFMTECPIPSLRDVFFPQPQSLPQCSSLSLVQPREPKEAFSWILNRSSCVGEVVFADTSCPIGLKTYYAPSWVAPECSLPVPAPAIARMLLAAGAADGSVTTTEGLWTKEVVQSICNGHARQCVAFYEEAMRTEIAEANRPAIAFTNLPVPMDPSEIVSIQDHFFYAALRSYAMAVRHACGSNTAQGMALLEEFKKDISTSFRRLWSQNITTSRAYCTQLFENIFFAVHEKYNGENGGNGFQDKRSLHQWFSAVTDKISEYVIKAKGQRKMDVLAERIVTRTIGGVKNFCLQHPEHPYVRIEDVNVAGAEISDYCAGQLALYHKEQDEVLSVKQRNSAMYTACLGTMWACESVEEAIKHLTMQGPEYDTWAELLQLKREGFGLAPSALLSLAVTAPCSSPHVEHFSRIDGRRRADSHNGNRREREEEGEYGSSNTENDYASEELGSETNSISHTSHHSSSAGFTHASRASSSSMAMAANSGRVVSSSRGERTRSHQSEGNQNASPPQSASSSSLGNNTGNNNGGVMGFLSSVWGAFGGQTSSPPPQPPISNYRGGGGSNNANSSTVSERADDSPNQKKRKSFPSRFTLRKRGDSAAEQKRRKALDAAVQKGQCLLFTELEYERQALLKDLVRRLGEHRQRMESVGKQFNLGSDQTSDFNVIQRQFSSGFKDYRIARRAEDAADEIASKLRSMRERVRNSFASTRGE